MSKLSVGQRVKFNTDYAQGVVQGDTGTLVKVDPPAHPLSGTEITVKMDGSGEEVWALQKRVDLIADSPFKIGDRICTKKESGHWVGFEGTVISAVPHNVVITKQDERNTAYTVGKIFTVHDPSCYQLISERDTPKSKWPLKKGELLGLNDAPERKFKVGDKVEFTKDDDKGYAGYETGDVLTIVESDEWEQSRIADPTTDWDYVARRDSDGFGQFVNEGHLKAHVPSKWPLKKGDTVYTTNAETYDTVGHELTIYSVDEEDDVLPYEVKDESGQFEWVSPEDLTAEKPLTPAVGDKVRFTNGGKHHRWIEDTKPEGTVVERRENHMRVQWIDKDKDTTFSGFGLSVDEESIARRWEKIEEFTPEEPEYKFEVGQTVKVVNANDEHCFDEGTIGKVISIDEAGDKSSYAKGERPYEVQIGDNGLKQWMTENELEAYTPHALDDAKPGTAFTMYREGKPYFLAVKKAEGAWQQFKLGDNEVYVLQTLNESGAREHFDWDCYKPVLVK